MAPNGSRLSCGAKLECSGRRQLQALVRQHAPHHLNSEQSIFVASTTNCG